jgi:hypothetical protein
MLGHGDCGMGYDVGWSMSTKLYSKYMHWCTRTQWWASLSHLNKSKSSQVSCSRKLGNSMDSGTHLGGEKQTALGVLLKDSMSSDEIRSHGLLIPNDPVGWREVSSRFRCLAQGRLETVRVLTRLEATAFCYPTILLGGEKWAVGLDVLLRDAWKECKSWRD